MQKVWEDEILTKETKQDVFDEAVKRLYDAANYEGLDIDAEFRRKGTTVEWELQKRYTAATDGDPECPYCSITADGIQKMIICEKRFDGDADEYIDVVRIDPKDQKLSMEFMADVYNQNEGEVTTDDVEHKETIHFCPMCGRRLEASHEPA